MRAALLLAAVALAAPPAGAAEQAAPAKASGATGPAAASAPAPAPVSPLVAASRAARAAAGKAPVTRKVWTIEDLERLEKERPGGVNVVTASPDALLTSQGPAAGRQGVEDRYREIVTKADAEIAKLERELLAVSNPLLRGLGGDAKPRPAKDISAEIERWKVRKSQALQGLGEPSGAPRD